MKTVIHFQNVRKSIRDGASVTIRDIRIREHESVAFYGLSPEVVELLVQQMTGAAGFGQGRISILGTDVRSVNDQSWFSFMEQIGIYNSRSIFKESASIGENLAAVFRLKSDTSKEPQLSQSVWALAKLLQLTITDLSRNMAEASAPLRIEGEAWKNACISSARSLVVQSNRRTGKSGFPRVDGIGPADAEKASLHACLFHG